MRVRFWDLTKVTLNENKFSWTKCLLLGLLLASSNMSRPYYVVIFEDGNQQHWAKHEMAKWQLTMRDTVNPYNYWELTTFKSVIFRLTEALITLFRHQRATFFHIDLREDSNQVLCQKWRPKQWNRSRDTKGQHITLFHSNSVDQF